jgi:hypothetical protein
LGHGFGVHFVINVIIICNSTRFKHQSLNSSPPNFKQIFKRRRKFYNTQVNLKNAASPKEEIQSLQAYHWKLNLWWTCKQPKLQMKKSSNLIGVFELDRFLLISGLLQALNHLKFISSRRAGRIKQQLPLCQWQNQILCSFSTFMVRAEFKILTENALLNLYKSKWRYNILMPFGLMPLIFSLVKNHTKKRIWTWNTRKWPHFIFHFSAHYGKPKNKFYFKIIQ